VPKGAGAPVRLGLGAFPERAEGTLTITNGDNAKTRRPTPSNERADGHVGF